MPNTRNLRHLNLCFLNSTSKQQESPPISPIAPSTSSHHHHHHHHHHQNHGHVHHNPPCASPSSVNMIKNFNTLYDPTLSLHDHSLRSSSLSTVTTTITSFESEPEVEPEPADFAAAFSSQRFFFSSPGPSNSLIRYTNTSSHSLSSSLSFMDTHQNKGSDDDNNNMKKKKEEEEEEEEKKKKKNEKEEVVFNGSVAVPTYSPDPYLDFRRSMQEMVEARPELMDVKSNWNVLHELLLCYLALNPKRTHKFILRAFADLLVSLMPF